MPTDQLLRSAELREAGYWSDADPARPYLSDGTSALTYIGLPDPVVGERVCAVIEPAAGHEPPTLQELRDHLANQRGMALWKIPERLEIVTEWPLTATGKVQKYMLRKTIGA